MREHWNVQTLMVNNHISRWLTGGWGRVFSVQSGRWAERINPKASKQCLERSSFVDAGRYLLRMQVFS